MARRGSCMLPRRGLAENIGGAANDALLMMAREIIDTPSKAIAILNNPSIRAMLAARTLRDAVGADRPAPCSARRAGRSITCGAGAPAWR